MHAAKIYHRDLKPQNILVFKGGEILKLANFGTAKEIGEDEDDEVKTFAGTKGFIAPEVTEAETKYDGKADIFSMGVIMYSMLMTRDRISAQTHVYSEKDLTAGPHSQELKMLTLSCLEVEPENRPDIKQLLQALKELHRKSTPQPGSIKFNLENYEDAHEKEIKTISTQEDSCQQYDESIRPATEIPIIPPPAIKYY